MLRSVSNVVWICAIVVLLLGAGTATALRLTIGNIVVVTDGGFSPTTLPKHGYAPIKLHGYGKISTTDGKPPPILETLTLWFDKHGAVVDQGPADLPARPAGGDDHRGRPQATAAARSSARASAPRSSTSPNRGRSWPPRRSRSSTARRSTATRPCSPTPTSSVPAPTTYIVPVEIQKVHDGRYGFKTEAKIPRIAGGAGDAALRQADDRPRMDLQGQALSYANAECADGQLQGKGQFKFKDGTLLEGTLIKACTGKMRTRG